MTEDLDLYDCESVTMLLYDETLKKGCTLCNETLTVTILLSLFPS